MNHSKQDQKIKNALNFKQSKGELLPLLGLIGLILIAATVLDSTVYVKIHANGIYDKDIGRLFRIWGYLGTWVLIAVSMASIEISQQKKSGSTQKLSKQLVSPLSLLASTSLSGLLAEIVKIFVRRERPIGAGTYVFRNFLDQPFNTSLLGFPSSHTAVAFGGSWMLITLYPSLRIPCLVMATGCGITRILAGAHFLTDVIGGAILGIATSMLTSRLLRIKQ